MHVAGQRALVDQLPPRGRPTQGLGTRQSAEAGVGVKQEALDVLTQPLVEGRHGAPADAATVVQANLASGLQPRGRRCSSR